MPTLRTQSVDRALVSNLGFERTETRHRVYRLWLDGILVARTYISHGERELTRYHVSQMAKQMQFRTSEFVDAVECPLTRQDYCQILHDRVLDSDEC
jgi:hypothetical protein